MDYNEAFNLPKNYNKCTICGNEKSIGSAYDGSGRTISICLHCMGLKTPEKVPTKTNKK